MTRYLQQKFDFNTPEMTSVFDELSFWSSRFGALLFEQIEISPGLNILDLGCGAGFPLFELAHVFGASCRVTGVDIWRAALDRAHSKLKVYNLPNVGIVEADGARLPFRSGEFDLIVSNLGVNNFADPQAVFAECYRVCRPSGKMVLTTNVKGHMREFYDVFRETLQALGIERHMERLRANEGHRGTRENLSALLEDCGFRVSRVVERDFHMRYLDGSALLNHSLTKFGFLDGWRAVVEPVEEVEVFGAIEHRLNRLAREKGELRMTVPALYLEAEKL